MSTYIIIKSLVKWFIYRIFCKLLLKIVAILKKVDILLFEILKFHIKSLNLIADIAFVISAIEFFGRG